MGHPEKDIEDFKKWLVGFTDGDGTFNIYINKMNNKIIFTYKITQSTYNEQVLYRIKKELGVGRIVYSKDRNLCSYVLTDRNHIKNILIPIFDKYPLLTSKYFNYIKFKNALNISLNNSNNKLKLINNIKNMNMPEFYISPIWNTLNYDITKLNIKNQLLNENTNIQDIINRPWLVGFIEADGSFEYILKSKEPYRIVHAFVITQKRDLIVLIGIKHILKINTSILLKVPKNKNNYFKLEVTSKKTINYIIDYFYSHNMNLVFYSKKGFEFKIWSRSFNKIKYKKNPLLLNKIRTWIHTLRNNHKL